MLAFLFSRSKNMPCFVPGIIFFQIEREMSTIKLMTASLV